MNVMPRRLIQWAYDILALTKRSGTIIQFRKVKAHQTDDSTDSRRNQGHLVNLTEFSVVPDQPPTEDERSMQKIVPIAAGLGR